EGDEVVKVVAVDLLDRRPGEAEKRCRREKLGPLRGVKASILDRPLENLEIRDGVAAFDVLVRNEGTRPRDEPIEPGVPRSADGSASNRRGSVSIGRPVLGRPQFASHERRDPVAVALYISREYRG